MADQKKGQEGQGAHQRTARRPGRTLLRGLFAVAIAASSGPCGPLPGFVAAPWGSAAPPRIQVVRRVEEAGSPDGFEEAGSPEGSKTPDVGKSAIASVGFKPNTGKIGKWLSSRLEERDGDGEDVHLKARGDRIYPAMKAIIVAAGHLKDRGPLMAFPEWAKSGPEKHTVVDMSFRFVQTPEPLGDGAQVRIVGRDTDMHRLAGAIAADLRMNGHTKLMGAGAVSVSTALKAVLTSQVYLREEDYSTRVGCVPGFEYDVPRPREEGTMTAFSLHVMRI